MFIHDTEVVTLTKGNSVDIAGLSLTSGNRMESEATNEAVSQEVQPDMCSQLTPGIYMDKFHSSLEFNFGCALVLLIICGVFELSHILFCC